MSQLLLTLPWLLTLGQTPEPTTSVVEPLVQARLSFLAHDTDFDASGSNTEWNAALEAHSPELASGLRAEASLSFFLTGAGPTGQGVGFLDNGSSFRLRYRPASWMSQEGLTLGVYPLSSTRLYMGTLYPVTWERQAFPRRNGGEPAVEVRLARQQWTGFVALKSASVPNDLELEESRHYALLAGGSVEATPELRLELEGTYVDRGLVPGAAVMGVSLPVRARGTSARALWHRGASIGNNVDLSLYRGDPTFFERFFQSETYPGGIAASVALEGSLVSQDLEDVESGGSTLRTRAELAHAAALDARLKLGFLRVYGLAYYRTPSFIQVDVPGMPPFQAFRRDDNARAEVSGSLAVDYHLPDWGLTPGLLARVTVPAAFKGRGPGTLVGGRMLVVHGSNQLSVLPDGEDRKPVLTLRASARWDLGSVAGVLAEVFYVRDPNRTEFADDVSGQAVPVFMEPNAVGATVTLQARF